MGVALAVDGAAFSIYTSEGFHQRCITVDERVARDNKNEIVVPDYDAVGAMVAIARAAIKTVKLFKVRHVGIKGYVHDTQRKMYQIGEISGVLKAYLLTTRGIVPEMVSFALAKKHVTGSRHMVSQAILMEVVEQGLGVKVQNHLEADATIVARFLFDKTAVKEKEIDE